MTLTVQQVKELASGGPGRAGKAMYYLRQGRNQGTGLGGRNVLPPGQRSMLEELANQKPRTRVQIPDHPERTARTSPRRTEGPDLAPAELAWLQRLPLDPVKITFDDAVALASLAASVSFTDSPASARLVRSIWDPVKAMHDERVARAELERLRQGSDSLPSQLEQAMREAVESQHDGLHPSAVAAEAREAVQTFLDERSRAHGSALASAEEALETVRQTLAIQGETERSVTV